MIKRIKWPTRLTRANKKTLLARQIVDYLEKNPDAGDTLAGIADWWLRRHYLEQQVEDVAGALELLVKKGILSAHHTLNGVTIFKIKKV